MILVLHSDTHNIQRLNEASLRQLNQKLLSMLSHVKPNKLAQGILQLANAEKEDWQRFANTIVRFSHGQEIPDDDKTHAMSFILHTIAMTAAPGWTSLGNFAINRLLSTATWRLLRSKMFGIDKAQLELTDDLSSLLRNVETMLYSAIDSSDDS